MCCICCDGNKNSVAVFAHIIALIVFIYGLWINNFLTIGIAIVLALIGCVINRSIKKSQVKRRKKR